MGASAKEAILAAATQMAQARGYGGLNFRDIAEQVGIKAASIYHHFPSKADLGAAVAKRYCDDAAADLAALTDAAKDPAGALQAYPVIFRRSLERGNRLCLGSFMSAEHDGLPDEVRTEIQAFADLNVAWLGDLLAAAHVVRPDESVPRARAIFAAIAGAQLMARSRADIAVFDALIDGYRSAGLLPA